MKDNSLIPNGFFLASSQEISSFRVGQVISEGRRGIFPTLDLLYQNYVEHPALDNLKDYSVVSIQISSCGILDVNQKFAFKAKTATVVAIEKLSEVISRIAVCKEEEVAQS